MDKNQDHEFKSGHSLALIEKIQDFKLTLMLALRMKEDARRWLANHYEHDSRALIREKMIIQKRTF